jgi:hypothetical protein
MLVKSASHHELAWRLNLGEFSTAAICASVLEANGDAPFPPPPSATARGARHFDAVGNLKSAVILTLLVLALGRACRYLAKMSGTQIGGRKTELRVLSIVRNRPTTRRVPTCQTLSCTHFQNQCPEGAKDLVADASLRCNAPGAVTAFPELLMEEGRERLKLRN